ncbi:transglycosylase SLT domain-containing protein [Marinicella litoralis]|uniref:Soluble lytic murein transglycosylase n=1 Tax=Marinicella litoralis TaxID=644220 RepID=A0A4V3DIW9_9GAMM|nr:transglycosylase SLT domain-containing protein [Marinicella litoralis]TDR23861.1 soluble lytic murein transglycosylase [Marinicella litoralis]
MNITHKKNTGRTLISMRCLAVLCLITQSLVSMASVQQQRQLFGKLYSLALAGQEQQVQQQRQPLNGYPIEHYLDYALIQSKMQTLPESAIADFKTKHPNSPLNKRLKSAYLTALGNQAQWQKYLQHHQGFDQGKKQCWYLQARIKTGQTQGIEPLIQAMWLSGLSAPDACNPAFKWWQDQGHISENLYLQRIKLAYESRNSSLIEHLKKKLKQKPLWVDQALSLIKDPAASLQQSTQWPPTTETQWLVFKTSLWLAKKKPATLHGFWPQVKAAHALTMAQVNQIERQMALFAATDYEHFSIDAMKQLPADMKDDQIKAWIVRYHLFNQQWPDVLHALKQMSKRQLDQARWQYWLARAEAKLGNKAVAKSIFKKLSSQTNYYGFLAADHMRLPYQLCHQPPAPATANFTPPAGINRAIELHHIGFLSMARSEWNLGYRGLSKTDKQALAKRVQQEGWYAKSIAIMADLGQWENYQLRYPIAHQKIIQQHANGNKPMPQWVMAIIKQESAWTKDAVSHANAHGLMQLLPTTAKQLGQQLGINITQNNELHQAPLNILLGVQYQKNLYQQFDHPLLVAAAYNAGERKSIDWSQDFPASPDVWLETIPYRETRDYITKILSNVTIYDWLINKQPKRISHWMPTIPINQAASQPWPNATISQQLATIQCSP